MKEIEEFFKDVKRIADGIETIVKMNEKEIKDITEATCNCLNAQYEQLQQASQAVKAPVEVLPQTPIQQMPIQATIPVSNTVQSYTQEQLAVAMGRAVDAGKMQEIQTILAMFNVTSLVELKAEQYSELALRLKEIGVDV